MTDPEKSSTVYHQITLTVVIIGSNGRCACTINTHHDKGILIYHLHELLETVEAAFQTLYDKFGDAILGAFQLVIDVFQNNPDHLYHRNDKRAEGDRSCVEAKTVMDQINVMSLLIKSSRILGG